MQGRYGRGHVWLPTNRSDANPSVTSRLQLPQNSHSCLSSPYRTRTGTTLRSEDFKSGLEQQQDARHSGVDDGRDTPSDLSEHGGPPEVAGVGQTLEWVDPIEAALAEALTLAAKAGRFDTVETLSRELGARRLARNAPEMTTLEAERARRRGKP